ncbi:hypothetical protein [Pedobacter agri]|uniref:hypothetical protein n=1 Tax=Pedobacter agri TaxID=454586 RepID=UPI00292FBAE9|nr:hypothetical protein [Pedobacter agri]
MEREEFIKKILDNEGGNFLVSTTIIPSEPYGEICDTPLAAILNLDLSKISEEGKAVLEILENDAEFPYRENFSQMKFNLLGLCCVQDIFSGLVYDEYSVECFAAQNYFYYEGLSLIREYFYAGFNNLLKSSDHLVRTILEFNIRHCYFYDRCDQLHSHKPLREYIKNGFCPSNQSMLNNIFPKDNFCKPIKVKIQNLIKNLSNTSSHAFNPEHSIRSNGKMHFEYTMDSVLFWLNLNRVLPVILWSYYVSYPMLLHPKDIVAKFGFNPPLGLLISPNHFYVFEKTLDAEDMQEFKSYTANQQEVSDLSSFNDSRPDLTDEELKLSWSEDDHPFPDQKFNGLVLILAKMRATREVMANHCTMVEQEFAGDFSNLLKKHSKYSFWKEIYTKIK